MLFFLLCSTVLAQPPAGTARVVQFGGGVTRYYAYNGMYLGQSSPNSFGGSSYSDNRGVYSRTWKTGSSTNQYYSRPTPRKPLTYGRKPGMITSRGHVMVSPPGSSTLGVGIHRSR